jgi:rhodanese-related sulfurtransferase
MTMKALSTPVLTLLLFTSPSFAQQAPPTATTANPQAAQPAFKTRKLTRAEFDKLLAHPDRLVVIDVRRPDELTSIGGFPVYLSIQVADIEQRLAWIPKDRTVVTVSNHANRSGRVGDVLTSKGFKVAGTIGVQDYEAEGGTLTKIVRPRPAATQSQP